MSEVQLDARRFFTIDPDSANWLEDWVDVPEEVRFVRIRPPADVTDEKIKFIYDACVSRGITVKLEKRESKPDAIPKKKKEKSNLTPRKVVIKLIEESNSADKASLTRICDNIMAEVSI